MSVFDPALIDNPLLRAAFQGLLNDYKEYKDGLFEFIGMEGEIYPEPSIPTGSIALDEAIGIGGIPKGRLTIIAGEPSTGKTSLCLEIIKNQIKADPTKTNLYVDFESGAFTHTYAANMGYDINPNNMVIIKPDYMQQAMEITYRLISTGTIGVCVFDSIAGAYTKETAEKSAEKNASMASIPRVLSENLGKLCSKCGKTGTALILVNQVRTQMGASFSWVDISGGKAQKFFSSVRIDLEKKETEKKFDGSTNMERIVAKIKKNKVGAPYHSAEFDIQFGKGIIRESGILEKGIEKGYITSAGAGWVTFFDPETMEEKDKVQGRPNAIEYLQNNVEFTDQLEQLILGYKRDTDYTQELDEEVIENIDKELVEDIEAEA